MHDRDTEFGEYLDSRAAVMRRTAYLLCGGDRHRAEDLVQTTLTKIYTAWSRVRRDGSVDAYSRKIMVRAAIDESRRAYRRRESVVEVLPATPTRPARVTPDEPALPPAASSTSQKPPTTVTTEPSPPVSTHAPPNVLALRLVEHSPSGNGGKPTCSVPEVPFDNCDVRVEHGMARPDGTFVTAISSNLSEHDRAKSLRPPTDEPLVTKKNLITLAAHPDLNPS